MEQPPEIQNEEESGRNETHRGLVEFEERIDTMHETGAAQPDGTLFAEISAAPPDWHDFIVHAEEVLKLNEEQASEMETLIRKLLRGELNDPGEEDNLQKLADLKYRFDGIRKTEQKNNKQN